MGAESNLTTRGMKKNLKIAKDLERGVTGSELKKSHDIIFFNSA